MKKVEWPRLAALELWSARAMTLWSERPPRERLLLTILGIVAMLALLATLVVRPLLAARAEALADIRTYETLNARLRAAGPALAAQKPRRTGDPATIISGSASEYGVAIQGSEPEGDAIRVVIAEAPFDAVMRWLAEVEGSSDLRVIEAQFDRRPATGFVGARLLVAR